MNEQISSIQIKSGEQVFLGAFEITSIPDISIIDSSPNALQSVVDRYKSECGDLLKEVFQRHTTSELAKNISLELLWTTSPIENQPYKAKIRIFIIVRAIGRADTDKSMAELLKLFLSSFSQQKYEIAEFAPAALLETVDKVDSSHACALVKDESVVNLQNQYFPYCYSFGRIQPSKTDLSRLVNTLIEYPNCAISFQLLPTAFTPIESSEIDRITQALGTLQRGVTDQGLGNVSFSLAKRHAENYQYYAERKNAPLFEYNILVYGTAEGTSNIASRLFSLLTSGSADSTALKIVKLNNGDIRNGLHFYSQPWVINQQLLKTARNPQIWSSNAFSAFYRLPFLLSCEEASELFRLPIGCDNLSAGLVINEARKEAKTYTDNIINAGDITIGKLRSAANGAQIGFALKDLAKHMLVAGTPGSGKTTFSVSVLDRLWKDHKIPFLVIEPAKNEYRALIQSIPDIQIFKM